MYRLLLIISIFYINLNAFIVEPIDDRKKEDLSANKINDDKKITYKPFNKPIVIPIDKPIVNSIDKTVLIPIKNNQK